MEKIIYSSIFSGLVCGVGVVGSYLLGGVEHAVKGRIGISEPVPRLGFWLFLCRWIGIMFVAGISHSLSDPIINDGHLSPNEFLLTGIVGGIVIAIARQVLLWRWSFRAPPWYFLLDALYMTCWSIVTAFATYGAAAFILNKSLISELPVFLMVLQGNGFFRAFASNAEKRKLRTKKSST